MSKPNEPRIHIYRFFAMFTIGSATWMAVIAAVSDYPFHVIGTLGIFSTASMISGAFLGFLFGIPRSFSNADSRESGGSQPNTNLEQISDWLTKVLVGAGLAEFRNVGSFIANISEGLTDTWKGAPPVVYQATVITFFLIGFLWCYLESKRLSRCPRYTQYVVCPTPTSASAACLPLGKVRVTHGK
jgi:hypothetical protein